MVTKDTLLFGPLISVFIHQCIVAECRSLTTIAPLQKEVSFYYVDYLILVFILRKSKFCITVKHFKSGYFGKGLQWFQRHPICAVPKLFLMFITHFFVSETTFLFNPGIKHSICNPTSW